MIDFWGNKIFISVGEFEHEEYLNTSDVRDYGEKFREMASEMHRCEYINKEEFELEKADIYDLSEALATKYKEPNYPDYIFERACDLSDEQKKNLILLLMDDLPNQEYNEIELSFRKAKLESL
jgi:hypothetical protein